MIHLVRTIHFRPRWKPGDPAPMECRCGWQGDYTAFDDHRAEAAGKAPKRYGNRRNDLSFDQVHLERPGLERKERQKPGPKPKPKPVKPPKPAPWVPPHLRQVMCIRGHLGEWYVTKVGTANCRGCNRDLMRRTRKEKAA